MTEWDMPADKSPEQWAAEAAMRQAIALERIASTVNMLEPVLSELDKTIQEEARQLGLRG